ncbi:MAG TPA: formate dehydrogenase accessory sulfurtransferase FdhD [Anaerolineales bacterium]
MSDGTVFFNYHIYKDDEWQAVEAEVIDEGFLTIYVNGQELATLMCTPRDPLQLALGFLANEDFISSYDQVEIAHVCDAGDCADIWLSHSILDQPRRKIITSGCSGGQTFSDLAAHLEPVTSNLSVTPEQLSLLMTQLQSQDSLYARARGVHTSGLSDGERLVIIAEDVGRHNTLDRLRGECLQRGIDPAGMILLSTGRISSEMINKAAKMGCPLVASRTSPTSMSVGLAREWNITLCGYVRRTRMNVYAHPERLTRAKFSLQTPEYWVTDMQPAPGSD